MNVPISQEQLPDLSHLTEIEKARILDVLKRDERLTKRQNDKFIKLKQEIDLLESRSVDMPAEHIPNATNCARCLQAFGYFFNTGELCPQCGYKVCQSCRIDQVGGGGMFFKKPAPSDKPAWLCILCHKYNEYLMQTGEWIYLGQQSSTLKSALKQRSVSMGEALKVNLTGSQLVKLSLFPNKKNEIIQEIEQNNFKRSSFSKRYSMIKKSKSQSLAGNSGGDERFSDQATSSSSQTNKSSAATPTTSTLTSGQKPRNIFFANQLTTPNNVNSFASVSLATLAQSNSKLTPGADRSASNATLTPASTALSLKSDHGQNQYGEKKQPKTPGLMERLNLRPTKAEPEDMDDFDSVTSSEIDSVSTRSTNNLTNSSSAIKLAIVQATTPLEKTPEPQPRRNLTPILRTDGPHTTGSSRSSDRGATPTAGQDQPGPTIKAAATASTSTPISSPTPPQKASLRRGLSNSLTRLVHGRSGSSTRQSPPKKNATDDNNEDDELAQMDQVFATARETLNATTPKSSSSPTSSTNRSQPSLLPSKLFSKNSSAKSTASLYPDGSSKPRELAVDPVEEYLKMQVSDSGGHSVSAEKKSTFSLNPMNYRTMPARLRANSSKNAKLEKSMSKRSVNDPLESNERARIELKIAYEKVASYLSITVHRCENLASFQTKKDVYDPYVKVYLMPGPKDKNNKRKTSTKKNTSNPVFEETLRYTLSSSELDSHELWISVWHHDKFGKNKFLGEVRIKLHADALLTKGAEIAWYDLDTTPKKD